ncbi:hypothetical protein JL720_5899 [Aureococcus anophagefferens]|nr:hypothetical protein JL720_5899 [Aureococcus anophagefferens]
MYKQYRGSARIGESSALYAALQRVQVSASPLVGVLARVKATLAGGLDKRERRGRERKARRRERAATRASGGAELAGVGLRAALVEGRGRARRGSLLGGRRDGGARRGGFTMRLSRPSWKSAARRSKLGPGGSSVDAAAVRRAALEKRSEDAASGRPSTLEGIVQQGASPSCACCGATGGAGAAGGDGPRRSGAAAEPRGGGGARGDGGPPPRPSARRRRRARPRARRAAAEALEQFTDEEMLEETPEAVDALQLLSTALRRAEGGRLGGGTGGGTVDLYHLFDEYLRGLCDIAKTEAVVLFAHDARHYDATSALAAPVPGRLGVAVFYNRVAPARLEGGRTPRGRAARRAHAAAIRAAPRAARASARASGASLRREPPARLPASCADSDEEDEAVRSAPRPASPVLRRLARSSARAARRRAGASATGRAGARVPDEDRAHDGARRVVLRRAARRARRRASGAASPSTPRLGFVVSAADLERSRRAARDDADEAAAAREAAAATAAAAAGNHCVRRLDLASGAVTTVAGDGTRGYADGDAGGARFDEPTAVADADGATSGHRRIGGRPRTMHFVSFTLQPPGGVVAAIYGQFSAAKAQEIVVARPGGVLELLRPDEASGKVVSVATTPTFSVIRSLAPFRLTGGSRDYVVVGSDAGAVAVVEFDAAANPRALRGATVCFHAAALDVGFDNPTFAALELEYGDCDADASGEAVDETEKMLTHYELDLAQPRHAALVYALCGKGHRSSLRVLRHGVAVSEMAVSELPGRPSAVWTVRGRHDEPYDKYIVVSFTNATLVLSIGETVEEVTDSGFLATAPTLDVALLADNALLQAIEKAAANERQVAAALAGGEVIYFELDASGALAELGTKELGVEVACLDVGVVPAGRARAPFLALGGWDGSLRLLSLAPDELLRAAVDASTGQLGDARARFLGSRAVRLFRVDVGGAPGLLALSSRAWLCYAHAGRLETAPLSYDALEHAAGFKSEQCPEGVVAIAGSTLRIFVPDKLGETFNQSALPLRYTPRRLAVLPGGGHLLVVEADQHAYNDAERRAAAAQSLAGAPPGGGGGGGGGGDDMDLGDGAGGGGDGAPRVAVCGPTPPADGKWASCVRVVDPPRADARASSSASEAALSCATVSFAGRGGEVFVAVDDVPLGLAEFRGRLLVAVGATLRMYDLGKRKLLRKTEAALAPTLITKVEVVGDRIFVADAAMSVHLARYVRDRNRLAVFADDPVGRSHYHAGDVVTALRKATLVAGGAEGIVYATKRVAEDLDRTPGEVAKKLEDTRNRVL